MAKLLDIERIGQRTNKTWHHVGEQGQSQFTVEMSEDVQPIFDSVKRQAQNPTLKDFKLKAEISPVVLTEFCKQCSIKWGVSLREAFSEMMACDTNRAKVGWKTMTEGRDYRKFQAKHY